MLVLLMRLLSVYPKLAGPQFVARPLLFLLILPPVALLVALPFAIACFLALPRPLAVS